jgi:hypothetical protein
VPNGLHGHGLCVRQNGEPQHLVVHWLLGRQMRDITNNDLGLMCNVLGLRPVKMWEKSIGRRSRLWALVQKLLLEMSVEDVAVFITEMIGSEKKNTETFPEQLTLKCLGGLAADELKDFNTAQTKL